MQEHFKLVQQKYTQHKFYIQLTYKLLTYKYSHYLFNIIAVLHQILIRQAWYYEI